MPALGRSIGRNVTHDEGQYVGGGVAVEVLLGGGAAGAQMLVGAVAVEGAADVPVRGAEDAHVVRVSGVGDTWGECQREVRRFFR